MHRLISTITTITAITAAVTLVAACSGSPQQGAGSGGPVTYATGATFTMGISRDIGAFDPYHSELVLPYMQLAYDSLVNFQPGGQIVSGLAAHWTADANQATFTLKPGITCSDGTPLTASQVVQDLNYLKNPKSQSPLYGTEVPSAPFTVTANDAARTVHIAMQQPFGFLLQSLGTVPIACAKALTDPGTLKNTSEGTGPFVLTSVVPSESYTFTVRQGYTWGPNGASTTAPGTPATVILKIVSNETTAANLLLSGALNATQVLGPDRQRLASQGLDHADAQAVTGELWFNQRANRPGADLAVRRALTMALDLDQVTKVATSGLGKAASGLIAETPKPCSGNTVAGTLPVHDPAQATTLLDQAGWTKGSDGTRSKAGKPLKINLHDVTTQTGNSAAVELIAQQWEAIGVQVQITGDDANGLNATMFQTGDFDAYWDGFGFNLPTQVVPFVSGAQPPNGQNFAGIDNTDYDRLAAQAAAQAAPQACALWNEAEQALFRNLDVVPIADATLPTFLDKAQMQVSDGVVVPTSIRVLR